LLDIVGDLALTGKFLRGHILAARPGHAGNVAFAKVLKAWDKKRQSEVSFDLTKTVFDITGANFLISNNVVLSLQG
jgi:UDP-3-O-[3-hydroxymyristoyl] N-acetylglucosamine deacetylase/3-hydroxyacyl-[acyl-carrier-protein] dehydratase